jgi:hypothetical protein
MRTRRWMDHAVTVSMIVVGLSLLLPLVAVGMVSLGASAWAGLLCAVIGCFILYYAGILSRIHDERHARQARLQQPPTEDEFMQDVLNLTARHGNLTVQRQKDRS